MPRSYWLDLFTGTTWEEFLAAGGEVSGFRERRWKPTDGQAVVAAILDAKDNPVSHPVDAAKLARRPRALKAAIGPVTVPDSEEPTEQLEEAPDEATAAAKEPTLSHRDPVEPAQAGQRHGPGCLGGPQRPRPRLEGPPVQRAAQATGRSSLAVR